MARRGPKSSVRWHARKGWYYRHNGRLVYLGLGAGAGRAGWIHARNIATRIRDAELGAKRFRQMTCAEPSGG